jgi:hypothetical protein
VPVCANPLLASEANKIKNKPSRANLFDATILASNEVKNRNVLFMLWIGFNNSIFD